MMMTETSKWRHIPPFKHKPPAARLLRGGSLDDFGGLIRFAI